MGQRISCLEGSPRSPPETLLLVQERVFDNFSDRFQLPVRNIAICDIFTNQRLLKSH